MNKPVSVSNFPVIKHRMIHPSKTYPDQVNPVEGHYQGQTAMGVPNGYGKFVYIHSKDETHKHTFVYMGNFLNGVAHGPGKKLNG